MTIIDTCRRRIWGVHFALIPFDYKSEGLELQKGYFCCFLIISQALHNLSTLYSSFSFPLDFDYVFVKRIINIIVINIIIIDVYIYWK